MKMMTLTFDLETRDPFISSGHQQRAGIYLNPSLGEKAELVNEMHGFMLKVAVVREFSLRFIALFDSSGNLKDDAVQQILHHMSERRIVCLQDVVFANELFNALKSANPSSFS